MLKKSVKSFGKFLRALEYVEQAFESSRKLLKTLNFTTLLRKKLEAHSKLCAASECFLLKVFKRLLDAF